MRSYVKISESEFSAHDRRRPTQCINVIAFGFDRLRPDTEKITISMEEFAKQIQPSIDEHHMAILPTVKDFERNLTSFIRIPIYLDHDKNKIIGNNLAAQIVPKGGELLMQHTIEIFLDDTVLKWIFIEFFQNHFLNKYTHHDYFYDLGDNEKMFVTQEWNKNRFESIPWKNSRDMLCSIGSKIFYFSIGYIFHVVNEGNNMVSIDKIEFNDLSLTPSPRYKKCFAILVNSK